MSEQDDVLSDVGLVRLEQIRVLARAAAVHRRRSRNAARAFAVLLVATTFASVASRLHSRRTTASPVVALAPHPPAPRASGLPVSPLPRSASAVAVVYVQTDPTITDRWSITPRPHGWTTLTDQQLLDTLAATGKPASLVTIDGRESLLLRDGSAQPGRGSVVRQPF